MEIKDKRIKKIERQKIKKREVYSQINDVPGTYNEKKMRLV